MQNLGQKLCKLEVDKQQRIFKKPLSNHKINKSLRSLKTTNQLLRTVMKEELDLQWYNHTVKLISGVSLMMTKTVGVYSVQVTCLQLVGKLLRLQKKQQVHLLEHIQFRLNHILPLQLSLFQI